jgi:hypothetical protein
MVTLAEQPASQLHSPITCSAFFYETSCWLSTVSLQRYRHVLRRVTLGLYNILLISAPGPNETCLNPTTSYQGKRRFCESHAVYLQCLIEYIAMYKEKARLLSTVSDQCQRWVSKKTC